MKKTLIVVRGNTNGFGGAIDLAWKLYYQVIVHKYGKDYDITVLENPSRDQVIEALSAADAAIVFGHGFDDGSGAVLGGEGAKDKTGKNRDKKKGSNGSETLDTQALAEIRARRKRLGKGKMDFVENRTCSSAKDHWQALAWLLISKEYLGYPKSTFDLDPGAWSLPVKWN